MSKPRPKRRLDPAAHAPFQIVALANRISSSASRAYLRDFGVGVMEWRVLALVGREPGTTAHAVSQLSDIDKASVSRAVAALVRRGDIEAQADPADARRTLLRLTDAGERLHDAILAASLEREQLLLAGLRAEERRTLLDLMKRLAANMDTSTS